MKAKKVFLLCSILLCCVYLNAQENKALSDSLIKVIDTTTNNLTKADAYIELGDMHYATYTTDGYSKATQHYTSALQIAIASNDKQLQAYAYKALGSVYDALGDDNLTKALEYYTKSKDIVIANFKDTGMIGAVHLMVATVQQKIGDKIGCQNTITAAFKYIGKGNPPTKLYNLMSLMGAHFMGKFNDVALCKQYFEQMSNDTSYLQSKGAFPYYRYYWQVQMFLANANKQYKNVLRYGQNALALTTNKSDSLEVYYLLTNNAKQLGLFKEALAYKEIESNLYRSIVKAESLESTDNKLLKSELYLKNENEKLLTKQKKLQQKINTVLLIGLLLTVGLGYIILKLAQQRKKQNQLLQIQNEEKALLLGEIHHRVKNNLEMLQSMLFLQMREYPNEESVQSALGDANNRIQSIALLHKQLYSGNFSKTNVQLYFTEMLSRILDDINARRLHPIVFQSEIDDFALEPDTLLPLALLINECVTNSVKYAFTKESKANCITITIKSVLNNLHITYEDNGQVLLNSDDTKSGFGSRLIKALAKQLQGTLTINPKTSGWQYILVIPNKAV
jgi:two-component sensor histidine kinase